jgi:hypothetical protein
MVKREGWRVMVQGVRRRLGIQDLGVSVERPSPLLTRAPHRSLWPTRTPRRSPARLEVQDLGFRV